MNIFISVTFFGCFLYYEGFMPGKVITKIQEWASIHIATTSLILSMGHD